MRAEADPEFEPIAARIHANVGRQGFMNLVGAELSELTRGTCTIAVERRLAARGGGCDRRGVVDQKGGDAAVKEAVLLQQLRPALHGDGAGAARQFRQLGADQVHETLLADTGVDALGDRSEFGIRFGSHAISPHGLLMRSGGRSARMAQAISVSASMRGSVRSRPDR